MTKPLEAAVSRAMRNPDDWVLKIRYRSRNGEVNDRFVSPIRFEPNGQVLALCLCREEPRLFDLVRCEKFRLVPAAEVLMPVEIVPVRKDDVHVKPASETSGRRNGSRRALAHRDL